MTPPHPFTMTSLAGAVLSDDRLHRYWLWRVWDRSRPILVTCMFNPSDADERKDDPTISNLCKFARRWGYGGVLVINLHSIRSPDPRVVRSMSPQRRWGDAQHHALAHAISLAEEQDTPILVAWGGLAAPDDVRPFAEAAAGLEFVCLGLTSAGAPKHPMARGVHRIPDDQQPLPYRLAA